MITQTLSQTRNIISILEKAAKQMVGNNRDYYGRLQDNTVHYVYDNIEDASTAGTTDYLDSVMEIEAIYTTIYSLRKKLDAANSFHKISDLLNEEALIKEKINLSQTLAKNIGEPKFEAANNKFSKGLTKKMQMNLNNHANRLHLEAKALADRRTLINSNEKITIEKQEADVLNAHGLLNKAEK